MKIRHGFVSNSSSSSFITDFSSVKDCLTYMLDNHMQELDNKDRYDKERIKSIKLMIKNFKDLSKKNKSEDCPVAFHSCNFDTFIKKIEIDNKEYVYVATCNNVNWELSNPIDLLPMKNIYISYGKEYLTSDGLIHGGDIYDGFLDDIYINNHEFYVIDDKKIKKIKVSDKHCFGIDESEIIKE